MTPPRIVPHQTSDQDLNIGGRPAGEGYMLNGDDGPQYAATAEEARRLMDQGYTLIEGPPPEGPPTLGQVANMLVKFGLNPTGTAVDTIFKKIFKESIKEDGKLTFPEVAAEVIKTVLNPAASVTNLIVKGFQKLFGLTGGGGGGSQGTGNAGGQDSKPIEYPGETSPSTAEDSGGGGGGNPKPWIQTTQPSVVPGQEGHTTYKPQSLEQFQYGIPLSDIQLLEGGLQVAQENLPHGYKLMVWDGKVYAVPDDWPANKPPPRGS